MGGCLTFENPGFKKSKIPKLRQPVLTALESYADPAEVPLLQRLVEARQATLGDRPFETLEKLEHNCELVHGTLSFCWMNALRTSYALERRLDGPPVPSPEEMMEWANYKEGDYLPPEECRNVQDVVRKMARAIGILTTLRWEG